MECDERIMELNRALIGVNAFVVEANRRQTTRCRRLAAGIALLREVAECAEPTWPTDELPVMAMVRYELMERINAYLADLHAVEAELADECAGGEA